MAASCVNETYLPGVRLLEGVEITGEASKALAGADLVLVVTPVRGLQLAAAWIDKCGLGGDIPIVSCAKGVDPESLLTPLQTLARHMPGRARQLAVLSGPTFALELAAGDPSAAVIAAADDDLARNAQGMLNGASFRLYTNQDPRGVELAGALKNVMALASGVARGLGLGANANAALITRGLAELRRLGLRLGGREATFSGLAGLGDLVLTCTSELSRNFSVGMELGRGKSLDEVLASMPMVAEGVPTTRSAQALASQQQVEMPIVQKMHGILFEALSPAEAVEELLSRAPREEDDEQPVCSGSV